MIDFSTLILPSRCRYPQDHHRAQTSSAARPSRQSPKSHHLPHTTFFQRLGFTTNELRPRSPQTPPLETFPSPGLCQHHTPPQKTPSRSVLPGLAPSSPLPPDAEVRTIPQSLQSPASRFSVFAQKILSCTLGLGVKRSDTRRNLPSPSAPWGPQIQVCQQDSDLPNLISPCLPPPPS